MKIVLFCLSLVLISGPAIVIWTGPAISGPCDPNLQRC